jgi:hypothetical protein
MMRLVDLHPEWGVASDGVWWLRFDCPIHRPDGKILIYMATRPAANAVWQVKSPDLQDPKVPPYDTLTLIPSIGNPHHGKKLGRCTGHFVITNGEVTG